MTQQHTVITHERLQALAAHTVRAGDRTHGIEGVLALIDGSGPHEPIAYHDIPAPLQLILPLTTTMSAAVERRIEFTQQLLGNYYQFKPYYVALEQEAGDAENISGVERIASGSRSTAYSVEHERGLYVLRREVGIMPNRRWISPYNRLLGMSAVIGVDGVEQACAVSFYDGATVSTQMPGRRISDLHTDEIRDIPQQHVQHMMRMMLELGRRDVAIDINPDNSLYCPDAGFSEVDYHKWPGDSVDTIKDNVHQRFRTLFAVSRFGESRDQRIAARDDFMRKLAVASQVFE